MDYNQWVFVFSANVWLLSGHHLIDFDGVVLLPYPTNFLQYNKYLFNKLVFSALFYMLYSYLNIYYNIYHHVYTP